jgi:hypothetical protein
MSRKDKKKKGSHNNHQPNTPASSPGPTVVVSPAPEPQEAPPMTLVQETNAINNEAMQMAQEDDLSALTNDSRPEGTTLDDIWKVARDARDLFRSVQKRLEEETNGEKQKLRAAQEEAEALRVLYEEEQDKQAQRSNKILEDEERCQQSQATLAQEEKRLKQKEEEFSAEQKRVQEEHEAKQQELRRKNKELLEREETIAARELNAEDGFLQQRQDSLAALNGSVERLRQTLKDTEDQIAKEKVQWLQEQQEKRKNFQAKLEQDAEAHQQKLEQEAESARLDREKLEQQLEQRQEGLDKRESELKSKARQFQYQENDLQTQKEALEERAQQLAGQIREDLEHRLTDLEKRLQQAEQDRDANAALLRDREDIDRKFGQRTPEEVLAELENFRAENKRLNHELANLPNAQTSQRYTELLSESRAWQEERRAFQQRLAESERRLSSSEIAVIQLETVRDEKRALETSRDALRKAHDELRREVNTLIHRDEAQRPFPACSAIEEKEDWQRLHPSLGQVSSLKSFVEDLRHRIATDIEQPGLYYSLPILRSFLGGLAMGQLLILQGISGTGKTSLPRAFARAVGTSATVVEVQAGWRDPQDLIGHYNTFEKKFYEKELLKALYLAQTPYNQDLIHIVLLDEMNLSHPEQYFSDFLSAMELPEQDRRVVLIPHKAVGAPKRIEDGKLKLPPNVWFVGTANQDETTKDFAAKTYDRAHVMEFPASPEPFDAKKPDPRIGISFSELLKTFKAAQGQKLQDAQDAITFFDSSLRKPLETFEIGWGPRLVSQMKRYIPVVVIAGGTLSEATDHLLATRLIRRLRRRHDNRPEQVKELKNTLQKTWPWRNREQPEASLQIIEDELRYLGSSKPVEI